MQFNEYKLLDNQTDRLEEVTNKTVQRPQGSQTQQKDLTSIIFRKSKAEVVGIFPILIEVGKISDKGHTTKTRKGILYSEVTSPTAKIINPKVTVIHKANPEERTTIEIERIIENKCSEVCLHPLIEVQSAEEPKLHLNLLAETMMSVSVAGSLVIFPKNALRRTLLS